MHWEEASPSVDVSGRSHPVIFKVQTMKKTCRTRPIRFGLLFQDRNVPLAHLRRELEDEGFRIQSPEPLSPRGEWELQAQHPDQGILKCTGFPTLPIEQSDSETLRKKIPLHAKDLLREAGSMLEVLRWEPSMDPRKSRKESLRILLQLLGRRGVGLVDFASGLGWSKRELQLECSHDADLDILQLFDAHWVKNPQDSEQVWLHTHGLAELGGVDFDALQVGYAITHNLEGYLRTLGSASLDGELGKGFRFFRPDIHSPEFELVPAPEFTKRVPSHWSRNSDQDTMDRHNEPSRVVLCEPDGFLPTPSLALSDSGSLVWDPGLEERSRMNTRAQKTLELLSEFRTDFASYGTRTLVEVALEFPLAGAKETCIEVDWLGEDLFSGRVLYGDDEIGSQVLLPTRVIYDWEFDTCLGPITPRTFRVAARLSRVRDQMLGALGGQLH